MPKVFGGLTFIKRSSANGNLVVSISSLKRSTTSHLNLVLDELDSRQRDVLEAADSNDYYFE